MKNCFTVERELIGCHGWQQWWRPRRQSDIKWQAGGINKVALTYETRHTVSHVTLLVSSRKCTVRHNKAGGVNKAALTCETRGSRGHLHKCSPVVGWLGRWPWWWGSSSGWPWRWGTFTQVSGQSKTQQIQSFQFSFASYALVGGTLLMYFVKELAKLLVTDTQLFWDGSVIARRQEQKCWFTWLSGTLIHNLFDVE